MVEHAQKWMMGSSAHVQRNTKARHVKVTISTKINEHSNFLWQSIANHRLLNDSWKIVQLVKLTMALLKLGLHFITKINTTS